MAASLRLRCLFVFNSTLTRLPFIARRHFLSAAFHCKDAWDARLREPAIMNIKPASFYVDLDHKLLTTDRLHGVYGIDLDLFANAIVNPENLEGLEDILYRFRRTPAAIQLMPSTEHAVVRQFLEFGQHRVLMRILDDRVNYGIFLDDYCSSLAMDTFLKEKNFRDATKIAIQMMLQENFDKPLSRHLALYSCINYLRNPRPEPWDTEPPPPPPEEPTEHIVIRLPYLPPKYFDDHFDIKDPTKLLGKTLAMLSKQFDGELARTCFLIGYSLYEKWDKVERQCEEILQEKSSVFREAVDVVRKTIENIADDESGTRQAVSAKISPLLDEVEKTAIDGDLLGVAKELTEAAVKQYEQTDIDEQRVAYKRFAQERLNELQRKDDIFSREKRIEAIRLMKEDLKRREQLLFFFENFEVHAMNVEKYDAVAAEVQAKKDAMKKKDGDDDYIPPDVTYKPHNRL